MFNYLGEAISGTPEYADDSFYHINEYGEKVPNWRKPDKFVDEHGFDKSYKGSDGYYDIIILPIGFKLKRYGSANGFLTTDIDCPYEYLGLPYKVESLEYHEYEVACDNYKVRCVVRRGIVFPMFDSPGGGIQYLHSLSIKDELTAGRITEVTKWN